MITSLIKLDALGRVSQCALALRARVMPIAFLVIGSSFIGASVIAETESENSSDIFSEPIRVDVQEEKDETEVQPGIPPNSPSKSIDNSSPQISDIIEVNSRSEQWEQIQTGDSSRGTIKLRFR